ncbi:MAG: Uma2 family endonuclease [Micromonosporaceae bacterium]
MTKEPALHPAGEAWTVEDLIQLPDDGNRYEIAHGSLLVTPPAAVRHGRAAHRLCQRLIALAPDELTATTVGIGIDFSDISGGRSFYIPDIMVVPRTALDADVDALQPADIVLAVEVLSPSNAGNDLILKRHDYAAAGIPNYWIVDPRAHTLTVLEHDGKSGYDEVATVKAGEPWRSDRPFPLEIDPADVT